MKNCEEQHKETLNLVDSYRIRQDVNLEIKGK